MANNNRHKTQNSLISSLRIPSTHTAAGWQSPAWTGRHDDIRDGLSASAARMRFLVIYIRYQVGSDLLQRDDDDDDGKMEFSLSAREMCLNWGGIIVAQIFYSHNTIVINTKRRTSAGPPYACPSGRPPCTLQEGDLNSSHVCRVISLT